MLATAGALRHEDAPMPRAAARASKPTYHSVMNSTVSAPPFKVCILDNDNLDPAVADTYVSYGAMTEKMFGAAGVRWR